MNELTPCKRVNPAKIARWRNIVACLKLSSLKDKWRRGKSRTCMTMAKMEKDKMKTSTKCFSLERGPPEWVSET